MAYGPGIWRALRTRHIRNWVEPRLAFLAAASACVGLAASRSCSHTEEHRLSNWSATHECRPQNLIVPENQEELIQIIQSYHDRGAKLRCMGSGLSPNGLGFSSPRTPTADEDILSMACLDNVISVDKEKLCVTVEAGITVRALLTFLRSHEMTLANIASISDQQIGGLVQSGCHGTGASIPPVEEQIVEMELLTPAKGILSLSQSSNPELFALAKCGLGALGIVTNVTLQCVSKHYLVEETQVLHIKDIYEKHVARLRKYAHVRYLYIPYTDKVVVIQCHLISESEARDKSFVAKNYPPANTELRKRTSALCALYREHCEEKACEDCQDWTFTQFRDALIALDPLNKAHIKRVNEAEAEFWKLCQGFKVELSDELIGFECGGQQLVDEFAFAVHKPCEDLVVAENLLRAIERAQVPAPSPIEQRWSARSTSVMSPAYAIDETLFCWLGTIMYLPMEERRIRQTVTKHFELYKQISWSILKDFEAAEHWAKLEWPKELESEESIRRTCQNRFPLERFRIARGELDPKGILSNTFVDKLLQESSSKDSSCVSKFQDEFSMSGSNSRILR